MLRLPSKDAPPPVLCNGNPACERAVIDGATKTTPPTVPGNMLVHVHYTYMIVNQPTNKFNLNLIRGGDGDDDRHDACEPRRFHLQAPGTGAITLKPGQSASFKIDMITRMNDREQQRYLTCSMHLPVSGFTVKSIQSEDHKLHEFSTNTAPLFVTAVSGGKLVCQ